MNKLLEVFLSVLWFIIGIGFVRFTFSWFTTLINIVSADDFFYYTLWIAYIMVFIVGCFLLPCYVLAAHAFSKTDEQQL